MISAPSKPLKQNEKLALLGTFYGVKLYCVSSNIMPVMESREEMRLLIN